LKTLILRLRGRDDRNNADSGGNDCRREASGHSCSPDLQSFFVAALVAAQRAPGKTRQKP
jgi:hypothetical protein